MSETKKQNIKPNILVTGGAGFLGQRIVSELLKNDTPLKPGMIRVYDLNLPTSAICEEVEYVAGDIRNYKDLVKAFNGIDIVIHSAAIIDWGTHTEDEVLSINVSGTENVIRACKEAGVKHMVFTSSLDAVYNGKPLVNIDESLPYPAQHKTTYCRSKYLAEELVSKASKNGIATCILRPADIYGEADPYHIDSLINMAKSGFYVRLGNGKAKCQHVYVGNMANAHILAAKELWDGNELVNSNIYFITDGEGYNFFKFFDQIVVAAGYKIFPENFWLPRWFALSLGGISEFFAYIISPIKKYNVKLSRFAVIYTSTDFTFSSAKAKKDFNYTPKYSQEEAIELTADFYRKK